jgi:hypothetical protein
VNQNLLLIFAEVLAKKDLREFGNRVYFGRNKDESSELRQYAFISTVGNRDYLLGCGDTEEDALQHAIDNVATGLTPFCLIDDPSPENEYSWIM